MGVRAPVTPFRAKTPTESEVTEAAYAKRPSGLMATDCTSKMARVLIEQGRPVGPYGLSTHSVPPGSPVSWPTCGNVAAADAGQSRQFVAQLNRGIVREIEAVPAAVRRE